jgi:hypothetical protein
LSLKIRTPLSTIIPRSTGISEKLDAAVILIPFFQPSKKVAIKIIVGSGFLPLFYTLNFYPKAGFPGMNNVLSFSRIIQAHFPAQFSIQNLEFPLQRFAKEFIVHKMHWDFLYR